MSRKPKPIYSQEDWDSADPIDRLYMHLLEPHRWPLNNTEELRLERLRKVWSIMCDKPTMRARVKLISEVVDVTERTVYNDMEAAKMLFGDILKLDLDLEYRLAYEGYMLLYQKAKKEQDYETAKRCQDSALVLLSKIEERAPKRAKTYPAIVFTSDPAYLKARNAMDGEDIEFETIPNASLLEQKAT